MRRRIRSRRINATRRDAVVGTGLVAVIALIVYLSLTAVGGLPWQSRYAVWFDVPSAQRLQVNDDVRIHGVRVGRVAGVTPMAPSGAAPALARIRLSIDDDHGDLPTDTAVRIRAASALGAMYVDLRPGHRGARIPDGGRLAAGAATNSVDVTDLFDIFDRRTARHMQQTLGELGPGFAGQGAALNGTLATASGMLGPLRRVLAVLARPQTRLADAVRAYRRWMDVLEPVGPRIADLVDGGASTFDALAARRQDVGATIDAFPRVARSTTRALDVLRPDLDRLARFATELAPAARHVRGATSALDRTLRAGIAPLDRLPAFGDRLRPPLRTLARVAREPSTDGAVRKLTETVTALKPTLDTLAPAQISCNTLRNLLDGFGGVFKMGAGSEGPGLISLSLTHAGATGELFQAASPSPNIGINYYPHENAGECEAGNELHDAVHQRLTNPPGEQGTAHYATNAPADSYARARKAGLVDLPEAAK